MRGATRARSTTIARFCATCIPLSVYHPAGRGRRFTSPQIALNIRCVEFNTYTPNRAPGKFSKYSLSRGHRDTGSLLTISILLTDPAEVEGGTFITCARDGQEHVEHHVARGDALLFFSEKMHNVTPVSAGVRHSLVVELWQGRANTLDRFS